MQELEPVQRALVVSPHPDDAEFGCGGTVARLTQMGKEVCYLVATNGNKGGRDTDMTADYLVNTRQDEQRRAAERHQPSGPAFELFEAQRAFALTPHRASVRGGDPA